MSLHVLDDIPQGLCLLLTHFEKLNAEEYTSKLLPGNTTIYVDGEGYSRIILNPAVAILYTDYMVLCPDGDVK